MSPTAKTYAGLGLLCAISGSALALWRHNEIVEVVASLPFAASLIGALVQILRDQAAHERSLLLLDAQNHFVVGATSHMANVAFDKHVAFSEAYTEIAHAALLGLLRHGPTEKILNDAGALYTLREKHAVWLTSDMDKQLEAFEQALREIGAAAGFVKSTEGSAGYADARSKMLASMYRRFAQVMAFPKWEEEPLTDELAMAAVIRFLRKVLGTEELTNLRTLIMRKASKEFSGGA